MLISYREHWFDSYDSFFSISVRLFFFCWAALYFSSFQMRDFVRPYQWFCWFLQYYDLKGSTLWFWFVWNDIELHTLWGLSWWFGKHPQNVNWVSGLSINSHFKWAITVRWFSIQFQLTTTVKSLSFSCFHSHREYTIILYCEDTLLFGPCAPTNHMSLITGTKQNSDLNT